MTCLLFRARLSERETASEFLRLFKRAVVQFLEYLVIRHFGLEKLLAVAQYFEFVRPLDAVHFLVVAVALLLLGLLAGISVYCLPLGHDQHAGFLVKIKEDVLVAFFGNRDADGLPIA